MSTNSAWTLSETESARLKELETVVEANIKGYYEAGISLLAIRDEKLYRQQHDTFDDYCRDKWGIDRTYAHRLMEAAKVSADVLPTGNIPANERQARELSKVPAEKRAEVWQKVIDTAPDGGVTAQHVHNTVRPYRGDLYPKPVEKAIKGFPDNEHRNGAINLLLKTRDPRGTIARFLNVHDSLVSNLLYTTTDVRSTLEERREQAYLEVGRKIGRSDAETKAWLAEQRQEVV